MSVLYEHYNTGQDDNIAIFPPYYEAQTFTVEEDHTIRAVNLQVARLLGLPGTVTIQIRTTDGDGKPTSTVLCSGTFDGDEAEEGSFDWMWTTLGSGASLSAETKYAIVMMAPSADNTKPIYWGMDGSGPTYSGGSREYSEDEGDTWTVESGYDFMFEEWGASLQAVGGGAITPTGILGAHMIFFQTVGQGALAIAGALTRLPKIIVGAGSIVPSGVLGRFIKRTVGEGSITPSGSLTTVLRFVQAVGEGAVAIAGTLVKKIALTVGQGAITPTGSLLYRLGRNISITVITASYRSISTVTALYRKVRGETMET